MLCFCATIPNFLSQKSRNFLLRLHLLAHRGLVYQIHQTRAPMIVAEREDTAGDELACEQYRVE